MMEKKVLRDYQVEAAEEMVAAIKEGEKPLMLMATGSGKSLVSAEIIKQLDRPAIALAHRKELVEQNAQTLLEWTGRTVGVEMGNQKANEDDWIVSASVQSLHEGRLSRFLDNGHGSDRTLWVDEAHHATTRNESYERVINSFQGALFGCSATLDRLDSLPLLGFTGIRYHYGIEDGINDGYLVPIVARQVKLMGLDLTTVRKLAGDYHPGDLEKALRNSIYEAAKGLLDHYEGRQTLAFTRNIWHGEAILKTINELEKWECAKMVTGDTPREEREQLLEDFQVGAFDILINVGVLTEGTDLPPVACVAMLRPTMSRALYTQCVGRGTRLCPEHGKKDLLLLDFVGATKDHRLIGPAEALLGVDDEDLLADFDDVLEEMGGGDIQGAMEQALLRAREQMGAFRLAALRPAVWSESKTVDPFRSVRKFLVDLAGLAAVPMGEPPAPTAYDADASPAQKQMLQRHKLWPNEAKGDQPFTRRESSWIVSAIVGRMEAGLCTIRQAHMLKARKLNPDVGFNEAQAIIGEIANNGWRVPAHLYAQYGQRGRR